MSMVLEEKHQLGRHAEERRSYRQGSLDKLWWGDHRRSDPSFQGSLRLRRLLIRPRGAEARGPRGPVSRGPLAGVDQLELGLPRSPRDS